MTGFLKICISIYILYHIEKAREKYRRATRHLGRGGGGAKCKCKPPLHISRAGKMYYTQPRKTTLTIQNIFVANIYIWGAYSF